MIKFVRSVDEYGKYELECLAEDIPNLPIRNCVGDLLRSGSSCFVIDECSVLFFDQKTMTWIKGE